MRLGLDGKRVLVTGASRGIGAAIAERMLEEGANVLIVSRGSDHLADTDARLKARFGDQRVTSAICDCGRSDSLRSLSEYVRETWNGVDVVIAGVGDGRSVPDALPSDEQWARVWRQNFESGLHTARAFLPMLVDARGCLLFVGSIAGKEAFGAPVDYSTAKGAVVVLAKNMARKLGQQVRINVLLPGNVYFPGGSWDQKMKDDPERVRALVESTVPMKRFGTPDEMADAAAFLCSERASFITGSVLAVDGGQTVGIF